jgi:hypothetical protein
MMVVLPIFTFAWGVVDEGRRTVDAGRRAVALAYKRPVVYGLKINPDKTHGSENPYNYRDYRP